MLRNLSLILAMSVVMTACGGSDNKKSSSSKSSSSQVSSTVTTSSSSSVASSVAVSSSSSAPESSASSSSVSNIINVDMTTGWRGNSGGEVAISNEGVNVVMAAQGQGGVFDVEAPIMLEGAKVDFVINVSSEYAASGANLQPFAQAKSGTSWPGEWDCWINNADLTPGADQQVSCTIDTPEDVFDSTEYGAQIGLQAPDGTVTGTVLIKSVTITPAAESASSSSSSSDASSSASSMPSDPNDVAIGFSSNIDGWYIDGTGNKTTTATSLIEISHDAANSAMKIKPLDWSQNAATNYKYQLKYDFASPINATDGTASFTLVVPASYITDATATLQIIFYGTSTDYGATFPINGLTDNGDGTYTLSRAIPASAASALTTIGFQIAAAPSSATLLDPILVKNVLIAIP